jgi:hypothetical protein
MKGCRKGREGEGRERQRERGGGGRERGEEEGRQEADTDKSAPLNPPDFTYCMLGGEPH